MYPELSANGTTEPNSMLADTIFASLTNLDVGLNQQLQYLNQLLLHPGLEIVVLSLLIGAIVFLASTCFCNGIIRKDKRLLALPFYLITCSTLVLLFWDLGRGNPWTLNTPSLRLACYSSSVSVTLYMLHIFAPSIKLNRTWNYFVIIYTTAHIIAIPIILFTATISNNIISAALFVSNLVFITQLALLFRAKAPSINYLIAGKVTTIILADLIILYEFSTNHRYPIFYAGILAALLVEAAFISYMLLHQYISQQQERVRVHYQKIGAHQLKKQYNDTLRRLDHELRPPISGVIGIAELLLDNSLNKNQKDHLLTIRRAGDKLMKWLNRLNDWRALQLRQLSFDSIPFNFSALILKLCEDFQAKASDRKIEFEWQLTNNLPQLIKGDPARIKQVISGILDMAAHYSEQGDIILAIEPTPVKNNWKITVTDSQSGLQEEDLLFIQHRSKDQHALTSEGLYGHFEIQQRNWLIAEELANRMGGQLKIQRDGQHVTYSGELNLVRHTLLQRNENDYDQLLQNKRLLVVDESTSSRKIIAKRASNWGMKVTSLPNAVDALALIESINKLGSGFDLVIFDQDTPGMDGLSFAERICENHQLKNKPILIMLSGMHSQPATDNGRQHGIQRLLSKPVDPETLKITMAEELTISGARRQPPIIDDDQELMSEVSYSLQ